MNTHIYSQSQQSPAVAHDMHNQLPSINQHGQHSQHTQHSQPSQHSYSHPYSHSNSHSNSSNSSHSHSQHHSQPPPQHSQHHPQHQSQQQHHPPQLPAMNLPPPHGYSDQYAQHQPPQQSQQSQHQPPPSQHPQHSQHSQHSQHPQHAQHPQQSPHPQHAQQPPHPSHAAHSSHSSHSQHPQQQQQQAPLPPPPSHSQHAQRALPQSPQTQQQAPPPQVQQPPPPLAADAVHSPTSPSQEPTKPTPEQEAATRKALEPIVGSEGTRSYRLDVVQQPKRARMCGFGDKDRRPITPPPCVRIVVTDIASGKEVDCNEIEHTMFVLNVDLWSEDALKEVNLVRHTTTTPSISSTTPASYEQVDSTPYLPPPRESGYNTGSMYGHHGMNHYGQSSYSQGYVQSNNGYSTPNHYGGYNGSDYGMSYSSQNPGYGPPRVYGGPGDMMPQRMIQGSQPQGMFTRNLIGSLAASAFRLQDPADKIGIWFVLQDLSVRTEGNFRNTPGGISSGQIVNTGKAPVLASCFSDVFTVYSAKKFPGVCESTVLSKTFATQGIKIPIRKEGAGKNGRGEDDDDYE